MNNTAAPAGDTNRQDTTAVTNIQELDCFPVEERKINTKMKNAVIYARYSSDKQNEMSIEGQIEECQHYAASNDLLMVSAK